MMYRMMGVLFLCFCTSGCGNLRFAPSETQKKNAWLHTRAAAITARLAKAENTSEKLQALSSLSEIQSRALSRYYGLPKELPQADTAEDLLNEASYRLADEALEEAARQPQTQNVIDGILEFAIGISALLGGVYGAKAVQFFTQAKAKSQALREIIAGNELFKKENEAYSTAFKKAQGGQSCQTRQIVAELKG